MKKVWLIEGYIRDEAQTHVLGIMTWQPISDVQAVVGAAFAKQGERTRAMLQGHPAWVNWQPPTLSAWQWRNNMSECFTTISHDVHTAYDEFIIRAYLLDVELQF